MFDNQAAAGIANGKLRMFSALDVAVSAHVTATQAVGDVFNRHVTTYRADHNGFGMLQNEVTVRALHLDQGNIGECDITLDRFP